MDVGFGVDHRRGQMKRSSKGGKSRRKSESLKVVYISSPMKVKTSPRRFRSLVQELTGKNSDISHYMVDGRGAERDFYHELDDLSDQFISSDSFLGPVEEMFASQLDELQLAGIFCTSSLSSSPSCDADVLGSYEELLL